MEHLNKWMGVRRAGECGGAGREGPCVCVLEWDDGPTGVRVSERCHLRSDFWGVAMDMPTLLRDPKTRWCETFEQNWCLHSTQELYTSKTASEFFVATSPEVCACPPITRIVSQRGTGRWSQLRVFLQEEWKVWQACECRERRVSAIKKHEKHYEFFQKRTWQKLTKHGKIYETSYIGLNVERLNFFYAESITHSGDF